MAFDRAYINGYLVSQHVDIAEVLRSFTPSDTTTGYGPAIDMALRQAGVSGDNLAVPANWPVFDGADEINVLILADYYALQRFARGFARWVDIADDAPYVSKKRGQMFDHIKDLMAQLKDDLKERGILGAGAFESGYFNIDIFEPDEASTL